MSLWHPFGASNLLDASAKVFIRHPSFGSVRVACPYLIGEASELDRLLWPVLRRRKWSELDALVEEVAEMRVADGLEQGGAGAGPFAVGPPGLFPFQFESVVYGQVTAWCSVLIARIQFPVSCVVEVLKHRIAPTQSVLSTVALELEVLEAANRAGGLDGSKNSATASALSFLGILRLLEDHDVVFVFVGDNVPARQLFHDPESNLSSLVSAFKVVDLHGVMSAEVIVVLWWEGVYWEVLFVLGVCPVCCIRRRLVGVVFVVRRGQIVVNVALSVPNGVECFEHVPRSLVGDAFVHEVTIVDFCRAFGSEDLGIVWVVPVYDRDPVFVHKEVRIALVAVDELGAVAVLDIGKRVIHLALVGVSVAGSAVVEELLHDHLWVDGGGIRRNRLQLALRLACVPGGPETESMAVEADDPVPCAPAGKRAMVRL